ncbi:MAG: hypothetical protein JXR37_07010 [Kiritimatiellae bacterium]|nr:hypothetical protein [Kiritimatiellia bacterium]
MPKQEAFYGLNALAERRGCRRAADARRHDAFLSERTIFRDPATGCLVWRMTCDPAVNQGFYQDNPSWNADGSLLAFATSRAGGSRRWVMDADGARVRPLPGPDGHARDIGFWSTRYPGRCYHAVSRNGRVELVAKNPWTGKQKIILRAFVPEGTLALDFAPPDTPVGVRVAQSSANALRVRWRPARATDTLHYNVYRGRRAVFACDQASRVASPPENECVDWGLAPGHDYWYRITAVDRAWNESAPSEAVRGFVAPFKPVEVRLRPGDAAERHNLLVVDSPAARGAVLYWHVPGSWGEPKEPGLAVWEFELPRAGEFAVWGRATHAKDQPAAFDLTLDQDIRFSASSISITGIPSRTGYLSAQSGFVQTR